MRIHSDMVPRLIHQFWHSPEPPPPIAALVATWRMQNPEYRHVLWNDETAARALTDHLGDEAMALFQACQIPAMRADVFRVAALYLFGGVYVDADEECLQSLDGLLESVDDVLLYQVPATAPDGTVARRIRNGFMAAVPHTSFFGRFLVAIFANIRGKIAKDLWLVTGPGVIPGVLASLDGRNSARIRIIEREEMFRFTKPNFNLDYRREEGHWSDQQKSRDIIQFSGEPPVEYLWTELVVLAAPGYLDAVADLQAALRNRGVDIGKERLGKDGIISWWHVAFARKLRDRVHFKNRTAGGFAILLSQRIVHCIRDPRIAIPLIAGENESNDRNNNVFGFRRAVLKRLYDVDIADMPPLAAAASTYALWNRRAGELATVGPIRLENPIVHELFEAASAVSLPELVAGAPEMVAHELAKYLDLYCSPRGRREASF